MLHILLNIIKIAFLLGFLILIHEGGHFLVAKLFKIKVNEFAIGFGPVIWKKQGKETKYCLRAIPLGGFVDLLGEENVSEEEGSYSKASRFKRICILLAGGTVNILFGITIFFTLIVCTGNFATTTVDEIMENYPAYSAGFQSGDKILEINNKKIKVKNQIDEIINLNNGEELRVIVKRDRKILELKVTPIYKEDEEVGYGRYYLGLIFGEATNQLNEKLYYGFWNTVDFAGSIVDNLKEMFTGKVRVEQLSGPVGISDAVIQTKNSSQFIYILALVSVSLGVTNLLPFPPLDGGKVLLLIIESIIRKPIKEKVNVAIQMTGLVLIMGLAVIVTYNDILKIF